MAQQWDKHGEKSPGGPLSSRQEMFKNNFPVTVKIRTSGYQTLECIIATPNSGLNPSLTVLSSFMWQYLSTSVTLYVVRVTMLYRRLVHVGETLTDFGLRNAQKCVWQPGSVRTRLAAIALPQPLPIIG